MSLRNAKAQYFTFATYYSLFKNNMHLICNNSQKGWPRARARQDHLMCASRRASCQTWTGPSVLPSRVPGDPPN